MSEADWLSNTFIHIVCTQPMGARCPSPVGLDVALTDLLETPIFPLNQSHNDQTPWQAKSNCHHAQFSGQILPSN